MNRIEAQYKTAGNLNTRISIHAKYSLNPQPFADWIVSHYEIAPGMRILELGCGTGDIWRDHLDLLSGGTKLTLTDFSAGMLEAAKKNLPDQENIAFQAVDIQDIPFPDNAFDAVIANMMLYHVPDLHKGLSEVRRVLKPGGKFYCATYGENGIMAYINDVLRPFHINGSIGKTFTLQNGGEILSAHFAKVQRFLREDGLAISDIGDFVDYIYSLSSLTDIGSVPR
ncbi:MAG: class I SAM-dependent methyltransferase, partial [Faecousia sp.]